MVGGVKALAALLLLKTSLMSLHHQTVSSAPFFLCLGGLVQGMKATARGTAAMGGGKFGVSNVWGLCGGEDGPSGVSEEVGV